MQPPTPSSPDVVAPQAPAAPAAPAAPPAGRIIIQLPNGPLEGLATSPQELQGLRERLRLLRDQYESATNQRSRLVDQLASVDRQHLPAEARVGLQQRLDLLDARILQIDRDMVQTDRVITATSPKVLAQEIAQRPPDRGPQVDEDAAMAGAFAAFGGGVLLTLIVGRLRRRFGRRRAGGLGKTAAPATDDPRIDRLAQAVDAIAEEVERIGEGQRFVTQILAQRPAEPALRIGETERR